MNINTATTVEPPRSKRDFVTPEQLRALLKQTTGYNARQVTVSKRSSNTYLTVMIRDPLVDVAKVRAFAAEFHTWTMDNTDYCEGQSVHVETTKEVNDAHGAPFMDEIRRLVPTIEAGHGAGLSTGAILWNSSQGFYVSRENGERGCYTWQFDVLVGAEWAIKALALQAARI